MPAGTALTGLTISDETVPDEFTPSGKPWAYELRPYPMGTRLVTRMRAGIDLPGGRMIENLFLSPGDGIMVRKQLLTLQRIIPLFLNLRQ